MTSAPPEVSTCTVPDLLHLEQVSKHYTPSADIAPVSVLKDVTLTIAAGAAVAIVGPSGSGKSTLLNIMGALDRPSAGVVRLGGRNLALLDDNTLARIRNREIGFVFQLHHLLPQCTALENVLIPTLAFGSASAAAQQRAMDLLAYVGLADRMRHLPGQLSGGECQRVAVVRALINQPRILLADEPTGALDHTAAENLIDLLIQLNREGQTLVVVTHAADIARRMHHRYLLRDGRLTPAHA